MNLNSIRPWRNIDRRSTRKIMVGSVPVGQILLLQFKL